MMAFFRRLPVPLACYVKASAFLLFSILLLYLGGDPLVLASVGLTTLSVSALTLNLFLIFAALLLFFESFTSYLAGFRAIPSV
jgi:hypothetical protein